VYAWFVALSGCSQREKTGETTERILPASLGKSGELLVIMDTALWRGYLGDSIRTVLQAPYPGILQEEPYFKARNVDPLRMSNTLEKFRTLVYVIVLDQPSAGGKKMMRFLSPQVLDQIKKGAEQWMMLRRNVDAQNQVVMLLFADSTQKLARLVGRHKQYLVQLLEDESVLQSSKEIFVKRNTSLENRVTQFANVQMTLPEPLQWAKADSSFIWLRSIGQQYDKSIVLWWEPYIAQNQFDQTSMVANRDLFMKSRITGSGQADTVSYMLTETQAPIAYRVWAKEPYQTEIRGLWRLQNNARGGSFLGRCMLDTALNRVIYLEGFVYAPGQSKREIIREFDAILRSARPSTTPNMPAP
jgi:hypothetical protein